VRDGPHLPAQDARTLATGPQHKTAGCASEVDTQVGTPPKGVDVSPDDERRGTVLRDIGRRLGSSALGPGKPIKRLSPFVTDTLFKVAGGPFAVERGGFPPIEHPEYRAATRMTPTDTAVVFYENPSEHILAHEAGHILDARRSAWEPLAQAAASMKDYQRRDYFSADPTEYVAEAFARAVESGRKGFADSTKVEREMPGTLPLIRWLQTRPPFAKPQEK
jgi:hypothetical protein